MIFSSWFLSHRQEAESLVETHSSETTKRWWILLCTCKQFIKNFFRGNTWIFKEFSTDVQRTHLVDVIFFSQELSNSFDGKALNEKQVFWRGMLVEYWFWGEELYSLHLQKNMNPVSLSEPGFLRCLNVLWIPMMA